MTIVSVHNICTDLKLIEPLFDKVREKLAKQMESTKSPQIRIEIMFVQCDSSNDKPKNDVSTLNEHVFNLLMRHFNLARTIVGNIPMKV